MSKSRIYLVQIGERQHLVEAVSRAQAVAHIARSTITASIPTQWELVELVSKGVELERAGEEPNDPQESMELGSAQSEDAND